MSKKKKGAGAKKARNVDMDGDDEDIAVQQPVKVKKDKKPKAAMAPLHPQQEKADEVKYPDPEPVLSVPEEPQASNSAAEYAPASEEILENVVEAPSDKPASASKPADPLVSLRDLMPSFDSPKPRLPEESDKMVPEDGLEVDSKVSLAAEALGSYSGMTAFEVPAPAKEFEGGGRDGASPSYDSEDDEEENDPQKSKLLARRDVFRAVLQCYDGHPLGILVQDGPWGEGVLVRAVRPKGVAADWNSRQLSEETQILAGDRIHSVDDEVIWQQKYSQARKALISATMSSRPFVLTFVRGSEKPPAGLLPDLDSEEAPAPELSNPQDLVLVPQEPEASPLTALSVESVAAGPSHSSSTSGGPSNPAVVSSSAKASSSSAPSGSAADILDMESAIAAIRRSTNALLNLSQEVGAGGDEAAVSDSPVPQAPDVFGCKPVSVPDSLLFRLPIGVMFMQGAGAYRVSTVRTELGRAVLSLVPSNALQNRLLVRSPPLIRDHSSQPGEVLAVVSEKLFSLSKVYRIRRPAAPAGSALPLRMDQGEVFATARRVVTQDRGRYGFRVFRGSDYSDETGELLFATRGDVRGHSFAIVNNRNEYVATVFPRGREEYCARVARGVDIGLLLALISLFEESPSTLSFPQSISAAPEFAASPAALPEPLGVEPLEDQEAPERVRRISI